MDLKILLPYGQYFFNGTMLTVFLSLAAVVFGSVVGVLLTGIRMSSFRMGKALGDGFVAVVRGTPLILQLFLVYYGMTAMPMMAAAIIALTLNSSAYISEILRAGIEAVDKGQTEAARSLGLSKAKTMRLVILPQAFKNILPALGNEFIVLIKESAIVSVIGVHDLMYNADTIRGLTFRTYEPLIAVAVIYFALTFGLSKAMGRLERGLKLSD